MTKSKFGIKQERAIKKILGYQGNEELEYDCIEQNKTDGTAILLVKIGRIRHPITELDIDAAINDPWRLNKKDTPPHTTKRIKVHIDADGYITTGEIIPY